MASAVLHAHNSNLLTINHIVENSIQLKLIQFISKPIYMPWC